jgi:hypothetical protein
MRDLTGTIPGDAYRCARVWAAKRDTFTLRGRPPSHQNTARKASFASAFPSLTPTPPVTYQYQPPISQAKNNFAVFTGEAVEPHLTHSISMAFRSGFH